MQFSHALIALVAAGLANAQLPDVPACSLNCFVSALTSDGCSGLTDFACHCAKPQLISDITPCVEKACKVADQASVSNVVVAQCSSAGVPISLAPILTTSASDSTSTSSSAPTSTSASETVTATTTETASSSESSSASASASGSSSGSSGTTAAPSGSTTPSSGSGSTPAGTSTPLVSKTAGAPGATTSPAYNAGANVKGNLAGAAVMAAAAAYIL
ncbi:GPI-anchored CFEM domain protein B [Penicillium frequentans]|uniref:GPI-anchored CFEM domain protein B n=1 Tax=Penicillium frequentans TaxID=3151616 RepID=A0AAD6CVS5_9EURO|nr:GPI-anchored CFEM domain protein B [Penicillium glabrum]